MSGFEKPPIRSLQNFSGLLEIESHISNLDIRYRNKKNLRSLREISPEVFSKVRASDSLN